MRRCNPYYSGAENSYYFAYVNSSYLKGFFMSLCTLCPRNCDADRESGKTGFCSVTSKPRISRAALHHWEEPCISGSEGSGTVFFSGCTLKCVFCQNHEIALGQKGKNVSVERLSEIFLELEQKKANNINLVTASHYIPEVCKAIEISKNGGLKIPIVYNTSGYEKPSSLKMLSGLVDVYLPDFKYFFEETALKYSKAPNYPEIAKQAISEMVRQKPEIRFNEKGIITSGVIVRHMVLPKHVYEAKRIIEYLHKAYGNRIILSIMSQYTPVRNLPDFPELNRKLKKSEYEKVIDYAISIGVENAFIQEGDAAKESFIPEFDGEGV